MQQTKQSGSKKDKKLYQKCHKPCSRGVGERFLKHKFCQNFDASQQSLGHGNRFFGEMWGQPVCDKEESVEYNPP